MYAMKGVTNTWSNSSLFLNELRIFAMSLNKINYLHKEEHAFVGTGREKLVSNLDYSAVYSSLCYCRSYIFISKSSYKDNESSWMSVVIVMKCLYSYNIRKLK